MNESLLNRIEINPKVMMGKPVVKGTRVTVELILQKLAAKVPTAELLKDYPQLSEVDIQAALLFAAQSVGTEEYQLIS